MKLLKSLVSLTVSTVSLLVPDVVDRWLCNNLPGPIRFRWSKLWVREDEFHPSLNDHKEYALKLLPWEKNAYYRSLNKRRSIAHERDLARSVERVVKTFCSGGH